MTIEILRDVRLGSTLARYLREPTSGAVGLLLIPYALRSRVATRRDWLDGVEVDAYARAKGLRMPAWGVDSLVQVKVRGEAPPPAFSQGRTMRNSATVGRLTLTEQQVIREKDQTCIRTVMTHPAGWRVIHQLTGWGGRLDLASETVVENRGARPITLEALASFSLMGITPFAPDDAPGRLWLHRYRSVWSMEGRRESRRFEELQLERSWSGWGFRSERFGATGSLPVNGFFPMAVVEDAGAGVAWGAQLIHPGSWQMEAYRRDDAAAFSGGLADREFGHWSKTLRAGESFHAPPAILACVAGGREQVEHVLVSAQHHRLGPPPAAEASLPVVFNEWATSWGRPTPDNLVALARRLRRFGVRYLVIDDGWFSRNLPGRRVGMGDWEPNAALYPDGLRAVADQIRRAGLIPGLWFEYENARSGAAIAERPELFLHRDGVPLQVNDRLFFDFRRRDAQEYLAEKVIGTLRAGGFGYLKIDYNENIGFGVDGDESPGENLRAHLAGVQEFLRRIRRELPDLVMENCSSGGHRLEPSMLALTAMSSFSDAHECPEIPLIAANLHALLPPRQSLIWAVLRSSESEHRTVYSLAAGFLGRLCLSGDFLQLSPRQHDRLHEALRLYRQAASTLRRGRSRRLGPEVLSYRHPTGWQVVARERTDGKAMLVVAHAFAEPGRGDWSVPLGGTGWKVRAHFTSGRRAPRVRGDRLLLPNEGPWRGQVVLLTR